jgi:hypothetical protein
MVHGHRSGWVADLQCPRAFVLEVGHCCYDASNGTNHIPTVEMP